MKLKKMIAVLMSSVLVSTLFVGCATKSENEVTQNDEVKKEFTYWVAINSVTAQEMTDHNDHPAAIRLEEATGIYVDYINPPIGQEKEQMNLLLASGDNMPDLFSFDLKSDYRGGIEGAIAEGVILDATELIEEYAPNFMALINSNDELRKGVYTDSGSIGYFGATIPAVEMQGLPFNGPMVNKTMLDKADLDVPVTIADWEEMLAAFKAMGVKIPFSFGCNNKFVGIYNAFASAYGVPAGATFMQKSGVVSFGPMEEGYKEFLMLFAKWYDNGWLDPDFLSKSQWTDVRDDFDGGVMGASIMHLNSVISAPVVSVGQGNEENVAIAVPYPVLNEGDQLHFRHNTANINSVPKFISADAENPIDIVKWVDYLYSPEGINETSWGVKDDERFDDTYYIDDDGNKQYTDFINNNPAGKTPIQMYRQYMFYDFATVWDWENQSLIYDDDRQKACWTAWTDHADYDYDMPQTLTLTLEEDDEFSKIMGDITTYVNEMSAKYIMGIESLDDYDKFIATLEKMNVEDAVAIQQDALDRYMAR